MVLTIMNRLGMTTDELQHVTSRTKRKTGREDQKAEKP